MVPTSHRRHHGRRATLPAPRAVPHRTTVPTRYAKYDAARNAARGAKANMHSDGGR